MKLHPSRPRARGLRPIQELVGGFERYWNQSFERLNAYVRELQVEEAQRDDA